MKVFNFLILFEEHVMENEITIIQESMDIKL